ncbi:MAG TPA: hypothetical protein VF145_10570 [Chitinophagaceae bacterium]
MRIFILLVAVCSLNTALSQSKYYNRTFEAKYMEKPPVFPKGADSLRRFYFNHFPAFDTVISKAVENGDTAKFIRVYFSFTVDEQGFIYDPLFERVASTRSVATESAKTIRYFASLKQLMQDAVTSMFRKMPQWQPGVQDGIPVKATCYDYLEFWCGLSAPQ